MMKSNSFRLQSVLALVPLSRDIFSHSSCVRPMIIPYNFIKYDDSSIFWFANLCFFKKFSLNVGNRSVALIIIVLEFSQRSRTRRRLPLCLSVYHLSTMCLCINRDIYVNVRTHTHTHTHTSLFIMRKWLTQMWRAGQASLTSVGQAVRKGRSQAAWSPGARAEAWSLWID